MARYLAVTLRLTLLLAAACAPDSSSQQQPGSSTATGTCAAGASQMCKCVDGRPGVQSCQVDKTFGACNCNGAAAAGAPAAAGGNIPVLPVTPSAQAGTPATPPPNSMTTAPMFPLPGGPAMQPGMPAAPPPMPIKVPPEDVAACTGMGAAPPADEQVMVLKVRTSDVVPGGYKAPGGTYYGCFWVEIDMPEKAHIVGWEGAVGGDRAIHHQQVSLSAKPFYLAQQGGLCGLPTVDYTWTGERPPEWTPPMAGYPIGGPENGGKARFLWQVHFESATMYTGGFNAYITKKLRKYDAGNFEQGDVSGIKIPPMAAATHEARCTADMTKMKLVQPIYVYASMLHAHLTVKHIKSQQFRDGKVLNTFGDANASGFAGFFDQSFKPHMPCIEILPGDELVTTCDYQNPWNVEVTGGEASNQEMCTTFMQYFPRLPGTSNNFCGTIDATGGFKPGM